MRVPHVDIVVPVRNEERDLAPSVRRLAAYLRESFPFHAQITIADNGSTDATWVIADRLARELPEVRAVHMELPGRGRALRAIWSQSEAEVLAYMDVDLSTDLNALAAIYDSAKGEDEIQDQVLFAYSQRREPEAVDKLLAVAKTDPSIERRKQALFWLGQKRDPRVNALIRDLIIKPDLNEQ